LLGLESFCEYVALKEELTIGYLHTSSSGNMGPYPDSEEDKVTTVRRAKFLKTTFWGELCYGFLLIVTFGLFWLLLYWFPWCILNVRYTVVETEDVSAEFVLLEALDGQKEILRIKKLQKCGNPVAMSQDRNFLNIRSKLPVMSELTSEKSPLLKDPSNKTSQVRFIDWRHVRLWYNPESEGWHQLKFGPSYGNFETIHRAAQKFAIGKDADVQKFQQLFGENTIEVDVQPYLTILCLQFLSPFFVFQLYSVAVWIYGNYILYSVCLMLITVGTLMYSSWEVRKAQTSLQTLARSEGVLNKIQFTADGWNSNPVHSSQLVPGNLVQVTNGMVCPCDFVLLSGQCIVNEAMLTGESAPVIKEPLPLQGQDFSPQTNRSLKHMLLSGSEVMVAKKSSQPPFSNDGAPSIWDLSPASTPIVAMVLQTGSETAKGQLISTLQYPQDARGFSHNQKAEAYKFVSFIGGISVLACCWFVFFSLRYANDDTEMIIFGTLNLTTNLLPAALPLVLSIGVAFAFDSLKRKGIFASSTTHIVTAGHVDCICYDKTGTLTTEGDTFDGVYTVTQQGSAARFQPIARSVDELAEDNMFHYILASCHSLTSLKKEGIAETELIGEQLELEMFHASTWACHEIEAQPEGKPQSVRGFEIPSYCTTCFFPPKEDQAFLAVLRIFSFDAELRTMSTIVQALGPKTKQQSRQFLLVKGAPEAIKKACQPQTLPSDFDAFLEGLAKEGYRVLGCAYKELKTDVKKLQQEARSSLEKELIFSGFLVMGNRLKPETNGVLKEVKAAEVRQCMVTGDNIFTALAVARQCDEAFIAHHAGPTYVVDFPGFYEIDEDDFNLESFTFTHIPAENGGTENPIFSTFEELLKAVECNECHFTLALSGSALNALIEMHVFDRPDDFALSRRQHVSSAASSVVSSVRSYFKVQHKYTALQLVLSVANVYARCKPHEKQMLVSALQKLSGHYVCMVGDGANDAFALKTADIGLSISSNTQLPDNYNNEDVSGRVQMSAAPSIAAPFTTSTNNISPVKELICEGRAALASNMIGFRHMLHYGILDLSLLLILDYNTTHFANNMWLAGDLLVNLPLVLVLNTTACSSRLEKGVPETSIMGARFFYSYIGHAFLFIITQVLVLDYIHHQPWYIDYQSTEANSGMMDGSSYTMDTTAIFWVQISQYFISGVTLSHDYGGFRSKCWSNKYFVVVSTYILAALCVIISCNTYGPVRLLFETVDMPEIFAWEMICFLFLICLIHILFESTVPHRARPSFDSLKYFQEKNAKKKIRFIEASTPTVSDHLV